MWLLAYYVVQKDLLNRGKIKDLIDQCGYGNREAVRDLLGKIKPNVYHVWFAFYVLCVIVNFGFNNRKGRHHC